MLKQEKDKYGNTNGVSMTTMGIAVGAFMFVAVSWYLVTELADTKRLVAEQLALSSVSSASGVARHCPTLPAPSAAAVVSTSGSAPPASTAVVPANAWNANMPANVVVVPPPTVSGSFFALRWSPDYVYDFLADAPDFTKYRREEIEKMVKEINWAHSVKVLPDLTSKGAFFGPEAWPNFWTAIPDNMHGKSFLDIGAWDGLWSFYAEDRGARVHSVDYCCWGGNEYGSYKPVGWKSDCCSGGDGLGYKLAHSLRGSKARATRLNVYDLHPDALGGQKFDIVFFAGVLYHLQYPMLAIQRIASVCNDLLILETHYEKQLSPEVAAWMYYPGAELNGDPSNWWGPNVKGLVGMLEASGFRRVVVHAEEKNRIIVRAYKS